MAGFSERSGWYKVSVLCLVLGFPVFSFGFGYPAWANFELFGITVQAGLWQVCTDKLESCTVYEIGQQEAWFEAVRGLLALSAALYILTLGVAVKQSCSTPQTLTSDGSILILMSFLTGSIGMCGVVVYGSQIHLGLLGHFAISYWLSLLGTGAALAAGFLLSINRRSYRGSVVHPTHIRQHGIAPPRYIGHPRVGQPAVIGGPMLPGYQSTPVGQPPGYTMTHGLSPGYPPRQDLSQGYPGPPPAYSVLPGQTQGVGAWPVGNQGIPPPPVYSEADIKE